MVGAYRLPMDTGSSPRARGTVKGFTFKFRFCRFIPASAGNRSSCWGNALPCPVHPRERGEQDKLIIDVGNLSGSSPRARGTVKGALPRRRPGRFIPASAGNRSSRWIMMVVTTVHPRERGEQGSKKSSMPSTAGSSPRARGTGSHSEFQCQFSRFIPASAGNRYEVSPCVD